MARVIHGATPRHAVAGTPEEEVGEMWVWIVVFIVIVVAIAALWIGNTVRWTKRNRNLERRSPKTFGGNEDVDEQNHHR